MKFKFNTKNTDEILSDIRNVLNGRELGKIVSLEKDGDKILVKISKLGTSTLCFTPDSSGTYCLESEKIAFTHKAFKSEVTDKFIHVVEKAGGKVDK